MTTSGAACCTIARLGSARFWCCSSSSSPSSRVRSRRTARARRPSRRASGRRRPTGSARRRSAKTSTHRSIWGARQSLIIAFAAGGDRDTDRRARGRGVGLPRWRHRRRPLDGDRHPARHPDLPALHRHRRVPAQRRTARHHHHPRGAQLVLQRATITGASALDAQSGLLESRQRPRRTRQLHHRGRDVAVHEFAHRGGVLPQRRLLGADCRGSAVHRTR